MASEMLLPEPAKTVLRLDPVWRRTLGRGLAISLGTRLLILAVGCVAVLSPTGKVATADHGNDRVVLLPAKWDASWYLGIAAGGYRWKPERRNSRLAFFPAYPMSLRAVAQTLHLPVREAPWLWAGVGLSTLFFGLALGFIGRITNALYGEQVALWSVLLTAAYPFALFHGQVYSESLFLLSIAAATWAGLNGSWRLCFLAGAVAGLSRPTGVLATLLVAWALQRRASKESLNWRHYMSASGPLVGLASYCVFVYALTGHPLTWLTDQAGWGRVVQHPYVLLTNLATRIVELGPVGYLSAAPYEAINVAAFLVGLGGVVPVWRRIGWGPGLFVLFSVTIPFIIGGFPSMGRYTCVLFPLFMLLALSPPKFVRPLLVVMACAQAFLATKFFTSLPVF